MKRIPIGISSFKRLREDDCYYIDKTLLVREVWEQGGQVTLMPRPRRFGKTLNLSMLQCFFEKTPQSNVHLFEGLAVGQDAGMMKHQGQYPVISLTFKDVKEETWEVAYQKMVLLLVGEAARHRNVVDANPQLCSSPVYKSYQRLCDEQGSQGDVSNSLKNLSELLHAAYGKRPLILIDEYDTPINASYVSGYYQSMINFMRGLLGACFKDNDHLERGVLTGILRVAREGIFSGLNNLEVFTVLDKAAADKFGFTQEEVATMLADYSLQDREEKITQWYNGYRFGDEEKGNTLVTIYNPWSLINCVKNDGRLQPYWANTSDNAIIKRIIARSHESVKKDFQELMEGKVISRYIDENVVLTNIEQNDNAIWSLLLFSGYLTSVGQEEYQDRLLHKLTIPNTELRVLFQDLIDQALIPAISSAGVHEFFEALISGRATLVEAILQELIVKTASYYDFSDQDPERSYHLFILGLLVSLGGKYHIKSNRESGLGRYDLMLIPVERTKPGVIIEFKKVREKEVELEEAAQDALRQIEEQGYRTELQTAGVSTIYAYGIAFKGKKLLVKKGN